MERAAWAAARHAVAIKADVFAFLGDLSDPDSPEAFDAVLVALVIARHLADHDVRSVWIAGNHDVIEDGRCSSTLAPLHAVTELAHVPTELPWAGGRLLCLPFTPAAASYDESEFVEQFAASALPTEHVVVLSHMTSVLGVDAGSESTDMPRGRTVGLPLQALARLRRKCASVTVLQGHYHAASQIEADGVSVHMVGSLARLRFDEEHNSPRFAVLEVA